MSTSHDPNQPQGVAPKGQAQAQQPSPAVGLHFMAGVGDLVVAAAHFFAGSKDDDDEQEEAPTPRRFRPRFSTARPTRVGTGSCCRRPTGK